jgi:hypothetical protein
MMVVPKLIAENPDEFLATNKLHKIEADLWSTDHAVAMKTSRPFTALELRELYKQVSSEAAKVGRIMCPFGMVSVKMNEWISKIWNQRSKEKSKILDS